MNVKVLERFVATLAGVGGDEGGGVGAQDVQQVLCERRGIT